MKHVTPLRLRPEENPGQSASWDKQRLPQMNSAAAPYLNICWKGSLGVTAVVMYVAYVRAVPGGFEVARSQLNLRTKPLELCKQLPFKSAVTLQ